ncbi:MAG: alpha-N-arabinofuranosidase, partial [Bacteroidales bacterium]|nr:alpha-N-arabinofuranosidase [Candidatus Hennigimonas equi]
QDAEFIPVDVDAPAPVWAEYGAVPSVSVSASRKDGVMHVSLVNPSLDKSQTVTLDWDAYKAGAKVSGVILNAKDVHDFNDFGKEAKVVNKEFTGIKKNSKAVVVELPAASIVTLEIK